MEFTKDGVHARNAIIKHVKFRGYDTKLKSTKIWASFNEVQMQLDQEVIVLKIIGSMGSLHYQFRKGQILLK